MSKNRGKKKIIRTTWNLNSELLKWINTHFIAYKKIASRHVDLTYHKFEYKGKILTQIEVVDRIIEITNYLIKDNDYHDLIFEKDQEEKVNTYKNELFDLLKEVFWCMWW